MCVIVFDKKHHDKYRLVSKFQATRESYNILEEWQGNRPNEGDESKGVGAGWGAGLQPPSRSENYVTFFGQNTNNSGSDTWEKTFQIYVVGKISISRK